MRAYALLLFLLPALASPAAPRVSASGTVIDQTTNQPIPNATVMVYSAGVKKGYDQFCPTCYVDCGKRAKTGEDGTFSIANLSPDLHFTLLVVHEGHSAQFIKKLDPAAGAAPAVKLSARTTPANPAQIVRGRVTDNKELPVADAVVSQQGAIFEFGRAYGDRDWIDLVAVTNANGEFELAYGKPLKAATLLISPRGMAPRLVTLAAGEKTHAVTATLGAVIRGRLVHDGKPVPNAELNLRTHSASAGTTFPDIRIGTNENGEFVITNVPPGRIWDLFPTMDSLAPLRLSAPVTNLATKDDGQEIDVGAISASRAYTLRGRIQLSDGKPIPPNMRLSLGASRLADRQVLTLPPDGAFEFNGLSRGVYVLSPAVGAYRTQDPEQPNEIFIDGNRDGLLLTLFPVTK